MIQRREPICRKAPLKRAAAPPRRILPPKADEGHSASQGRKAGYSDGGGQRQRKPIPKRRAKPRGKCAHDAKYLAWVAEKGCMVCCAPATIHHVRFCGSRRDDHLVLPLCPMHHQIQAGPRTSIEALGKAKFEAMYGVNMETRIVQYQREYAAAGFTLKVMP